MTKVISLELSKRLAPYLENVEAEYLIHKDRLWKISIVKSESVIWSISFNSVKDECIALNEEIYKTLTFKEIVIFLNDNCKSFMKAWIYIEIMLNLMPFNNNNDEMEIIEKLTTYLLDNNLLWQKN